MSSRRHLSPPAAPLDDENLLPEILLRLPPQPSSLPRASLVCKRWRSLASDPGFLRRFRIHHRRSPPLLGCFFQEPHGISFLPALEAPNRVPPGRLSFQSTHSNGLRLLNCRHGLVLIADKTRHDQFLVWDTITGEQYHLAVPALFDTAVAVLITGAVLRAVGDTHHFQVVCVATRRRDPQRRQAACVYSSETGAWGNVISTHIPSDLDSQSRFNLYLFGITTTPAPAMLLGDSLYCTLTDDSSSILEFDLLRQSLAVIRMPKDVYKYKGHITVTRADSGGLGFLMVTDFTLQLWKRKIDCDGVASWGLEKTIELDKLLSLNPEKGSIMILGFAEENKMVFLGTFIGLFVLQLQSLQFKKLSETETVFHCHPFESVYTAETDVGGEHGRAELLNNA
ncbi:hypothetical protein CFC21_086649 [Triticum aestivum]|uniref:F-box domain-containing protein n=3 Tax=Triticum TaxID=4564 RepID=A0A9R0YGD1_TRITD|nr:uncharacterized protein LOC123135835 isoform X1 [Triticum aestivum]XP_044410998.1 uncharacterized protein LOC123135836 isoform X1 [Triticum aestivum]KAF7082798.1 hypothetical protein CFC21_086649 [Triticum aestivum]VAI53970.1 unnamed protein product [Triticum turgidum subsp. durum]